LTILLDNRWKSIFTLPIILFSETNIFQDIGETISPLEQETLANSKEGDLAITLFERLIETPNPFISFR
jgi:hypothetical protein